MEFLKSFKASMVLALIILFGNIQFSYGKTVDQCLRTTSDSPAVKNLFLIDEPYLFLLNMLDEFRLMRELFPILSEQEENEFMILLDRKYKQRNINDSDHDRFVVLDAKRTIDMFIDNMLRSLSYQSKAKDGDILGYLLAANTLQEAHLNDLVVSFMSAELLYIGKTSNSELASYISNLGGHYISDLNKHILLCIIPKSL